MSVFDRNVSFDRLPLPITRVNTLLPFLTFLTLLHLLADFDTFGRF